jgi:hypothetical protein
MEYSSSSCGAVLLCECGGECEEEGRAELDTTFALGLGDGALANAETIGRSLLGQVEARPPYRQIGSSERGVRVRPDWPWHQWFGFAGPLRQIDRGGRDGIPDVADDSLKVGPRCG